MKEFTSSKKAVEYCMKNKYFALAHLYNKEDPEDMHIHNCYQIQFFISGGKQFLIHNQLYNIAPGDIFFINQYESHYQTQTENNIHERIVISIYPDFLEKISSSKTDLKYCFTHREANIPHKLHLNIEMSRRFIYLIHKITDTEGFGSDLTEVCTLIELLILLNKLFCQSCENRQAKALYINHTKIEKILTFINSHISEDLTLETLSGHFDLSGSYLCRIFKSTTGITINKYITARRITIAKAFLKEGMPVTEACERCGFNDYSNFLKAFTKAVGISPKKYTQSKT